MSDKPHGPVGEQQMRRFYGPSGYIKDDDGRQATPHADLIAQILDSCVPKNEREHAAAREIERLRYALQIIAGKAQPADNTMSNVDVALAALKENSDE